MNISTLTKTTIVDIANQDIYDIYIDSRGNRYDETGRLIRRCAATAPATATATAEKEKKD